MNWLHNRIPPPLIASLIALLMWLGTQQWPINHQLSLTLRLAIALPLLLLGIVVCLAGVLSFQRARTTVNPLQPQRASALVSSGIYQHTRNPMYLGFAITLLAWTIIVAWPPALLGVAGFVVYMNRFQIAAEEHALSTLFEYDFARYCSHVRRWL
jgi:protein-S-isoprenylcysteine O-methyltransferase Ste14